MALLGIFLLFRTAKKKSQSELGGRAWLGPAGWSAALESGRLSLLKTDEGHQQTISLPLTAVKF